MITFVAGFVAGGISAFALGAWARGMYQREAMRQGTTFDPMGPYLAVHRKKRARLAGRWWES